MYRMIFAALLLTLAACPAADDGADFTPVDVGAYSARAGGPAPAPARTAAPANPPREAAAPSLPAQPAVDPQVQPPPAAQETPIAATPHADEPTPAASAPVTADDADAGVPDAPPPSPAVCQLPDAQGVPAAYRGARVGCDFPEWSMVVWDVNASWCMTGSATRKARALYVAPCAVGAACRVQQYVGGYQVGATLHGVCVLE